MVYVVYTDVYPKMQNTGYTMQNTYLCIIYNIIFIHVLRCINAQLTDPKCCSWFRPGTRGLHGALWPGCTGGEVEKWSIEVLGG